MSLYVTLPSNSNIQRAPGNRGGDFVVHLNDTLYLDSSWECGLSEAIYRRDFANIRKGENIIIFDRLENYDPALHLQWEKFKTLWASDAKGGGGGGADFKFNWKKVSHTVPPLERPSTRKELIKHVADSVAAIVPDFRMALSEDGRQKVTIKMPARGLSFGEKTKRILQMPADINPPPTPPPPVVEEKETAEATEGKVKGGENKIGGIKPTSSAGEEKKSSPTQDDKDATEPPAKKAKKDETKEKPSPPKTPPPPPPKTVEWNIEEDSRWPTERMKTSIKTEMINVPEGYYPTPPRLLKAIKEILPKLFDDNEMTLSLEAVDNGDFARITVKPRRSTLRRWWRLGMSQSLYEMLGLTPDQLVTTGDYYFIQDKDTPANPLEASVSQLVEKKGSFQVDGKRPIEISRGVDTLWIYSDIVTPQVVGDRQVPLLRIIPSKGKHFGETVMIHYDKPQYIALSQQNISAINVKIYNTYGLSPIPFNSDVILKIHFRKKKK